jgi:hypothetical protein
MQINAICQTMHADLVVTGATAILIQLGNLGRLNRDIDVAVALAIPEKLLIFDGR